MAISNKWRKSWKQPSFAAVHVVSSSFWNKVGPGRQCSLQVTPPSFSPSNLSIYTPSRAAPLVAHHHLLASPFIKSIREANQIVFPFIDHKQQVRSIDTNNMNSSLSRLSCSFSPPRAIWLICSIYQSLCMFIAASIYICMSKEFVACACSMHILHPGSLRWWPTDRPISFFSSIFFLHSQFVSGRTIFLYFSHHQVINKLGMNIQYIKYLFDILHLCNFFYFLFFFG